MLISALVYKQYQRDLLSLKGHQRGHYLRLTTIFIWSARNAVTVGLLSAKRGASRTAELTYYANHCEHCGTLIGDHYLTKPEGPFWPMTDQMKPIDLVLFDQPVEVHGQCGSVTFPLGPHTSEFEAPSPPRRPSRRKQRQ